MLEREEEPGWDRGCWDCGVCAHCGVTFEDGAPRQYCEICWFHYCDGCSEPVVHDCVTVSFEWNGRRP